MKTTKKFKVFAATFTVNGEFSFFADDKATARCHADHLSFDGFGKRIGDVRFVGFTTDNTQIEILRD